MKFQQQLQRSLKRYLLRSTVTRPQLTETISAIATSLPETVIFGGMVREFAFGNARKFVSDIDLVTLEAPAGIAKAISKYDPVLNKFGGFRFVVGKQRFDIWSLPDTWGFRHGFTTGVGFPDLLKTSFFNVDAACYHVNRSELICLDGYADWVNDRLLDINLAENPNPVGMAHRTLNLAQTHQLGMTKRLALYVVSNLRQKTLHWSEQLFVKKLIEFVENDDCEIFRLGLQSEIPA